ncbi:MAG TPA: YbdK family carboxylate-amine ligase, partial [Cyclobacteriaceae bacterium]|nr:YbdK family carboxylate-amine ligase [Cyclobacteriaceae bacterium]
MKTQNLLFKSNERILTLGVELEFQVIDNQSLLLAPRANEIIERAAHPQIKPEFFQSSLEIITGVCTTVFDAQTELKKLIGIVRKTAAEIDLKISSTGTHPEADYRDRLVTPSLRYNELMDRNQWIIRRMAVYGMHIHLGMRSGDVCIRYHNFFLHFVPHLLALSASSPFWHSLNTGLACARPTMYESMPTSGMPYIVKSWSAFENLYKTMVRTGSIKSIHDLWLDLRPSPELGTLELRMCDEPATLAEAMAITAYVHVLALWYEEHHEEWEHKHKALKRWVLRENKWRAIRYGLEGEMILATNKKTKFIHEDIYYWLEKVEPYVN